MEYIECPNEYFGIKQKLFLAGGITNCSDWQSEICELLKDTDFAVFNPRRTNFNKADAEQQIVWEHKYRLECDLVLFWFCKETLCPIALLELGYALGDKSQPIFVGIEPGYVRRYDVELQTQLSLPKTPVVYSLRDLVDAVKRK